MPDRRVTLVMTEAEREAVVRALEAVAPMGLGVGERVKVLTRHLERLRAARVSEWGRRR